jgi:hypothetical protein
VPVDTGVQASKQFWRRMPRLRLRSAQHRRALARTSSALKEFVASVICVYAGFLTWIQFVLVPSALLAAARELAHGALGFVRSRVTQLKFDRYQ